MNSAGLTQLILNPSVQMRQKGGPADCTANGPNFTQYMQNRANQENKRQELLGSAKEAERPVKEPEKEKEQSGPNENAAVFLLSVLTEMKRMAQDSDGKEGVFLLQGVDRQQFESLLQSMGLDAEEAGSFGQLLSEIDDPLRLDDFLTMLANRLEKLTVAEPVTIQETDLPFIQSLLARLGVSVGQIEGATEPAVRGDSRLDLKVLAEGLRQLANLANEGEGAAGAAISLSEWDLEQLRNMVAEAGLADGKGITLAGIDPDGLTTDQLAGFFERLTAAVQEQRPKIDVMAFAENLDRIFTSVKAGGEQPTWTPLMQDSLQQVYQKLQEIVDFAKVSVAGGEKTEVRQQYLAERADLKEAEAEAKALLTASAEGAGIEEGSGDPAAEAAAILKITRQSTDELTDPAAAIHSKAMPETAQPRESGPVFQPPPQVARPSPAILQQQIFDQISKGVLRGVQNGEHHLVLKLHPPELGEVKVDLLVHDDHVSVSFAMESSKVKHAMESTMQQFRDSLEQRGFVLQHCFVSVGDGNDPSDNWRRFEEAMNSRDDNALRQVELPGEMLYQRSTGQPVADGSINLFI